MDSKKENNLARIQIIQNYLNFLKKEIENELNPNKIMLDDMIQMLEKMREGR